jgi:hypothetical protein
VTILVLSVLLAMNAQAAPKKHELCGLATVAVVGDESPVKAVRKRIEKDTWLKRVDKSEQADAILEVRMRITSFSVSMSANRGPFGGAQGTLSMTLRPRGSEEPLWRGSRRLDSDPPLVDSLLKQLGSDAGCRAR